MTIRLTEDEFYEQFQEADEEQLQWDASDELDVTSKFDARFGQGWERRIWLRKGIYLQIQKGQYSDRLLTKYADLESPILRCSFTLSGKGQKILATTPSETTVPHTAGKYYLRSNGIRRQCFDDFDVNPYYFLQIQISPKILLSFSASRGELPKNLQHLVRPLSQEIYIRSKDTTPMMATVLQQILHCPYQGMVKRAYLESKVIELMALVLDHEIAIQQGEVKRVFLKPEQLERIYYAKEILLQNLSDPPSTIELAHQAGLNEFMLKQGFHQAFGTTVFGVLRNHRLELAKQILAEQDITVAEVAHRVGYASVPSFAKAFRRRFGLSPKEHQKACRS